MIDAHVHLGSIPSNGKNWGSFREYKSIAKKLGINRYGTVPIGLPENFTNNSTPDNNSVLKESEKNKSVIPVYWFNVFDLPENIDNRYKMFGAKRIIFGSDYLFGDPRVSLGMIESLNPTKKEYKLITEDNVKKILNL